MGEVNNMSVNPIVPNNSGPQGQQALNGAGAKSGDQAFHDMAKSKGYNSDELSKAVSDKTRLKRTKKIGSNHKVKQSSLFLVESEDGEVEEEPVYRTVMVDGAMFTLRLLAVA